MKKTIVPSHVIIMCISVLLSFQAKGQAITLATDKDRKEKHSSFLISVAGGTVFKAGGDIASQRQLGAGVGLGVLDDLMLMTLMANFKSNHQSLDSASSYPVIKASSADFLWSIGAPRTLSKRFAGTGVGLAARIKFTDVKDGNINPYSASLFWQFSLNTVKGAGTTIETGVLYYGLSGRIYYTLSKDPKSSGPAGFTGFYELCLTVYIR